MSETKKERAWYVVRAIGGKEHKVKEYLDAEIRRNGLQEQISQVLIPTEKVYTIRNGKKVSKERVSYPGYVLVEMVMTDDSWYVVRDTPGVTGFVGSSGAGSKPTPLMPDEVDAILRQMGMDEALQMKDAVSVGVEQTLSFIPNEEYIQAVSDVIKQAYEQNGVEVTECRFKGYEYLRETEMQT